MSATSTQVYTSVHNLHTLCCIPVCTAEPVYWTQENCVDQSQGFKLSFTHSLTHSLTHFSYVVIAQSKCCAIRKFPSSSIINNLSSSEFFLPLITSWGIGFPITSGHFATSCGSEPQLVGPINSFIGKSGVKSSKFLTNLILANNRIIQQPFMMCWSIQLIAINSATQNPICSVLSYLWHHCIPHLKWSMHYNQ
jgi:hypothetical protein